MFKPNTMQEKGNTMSTYKFAALPSNSSVTAVVTAMVSAWFLVAGAAILTDSHSGNAVRAAQDQRAAANIAPEARLTIVVEASRSDATL
jgi:branched-subunit amino acid ABC-type transport system permease component